jgi:integrase/recombinase XerD
MDQVKSKMQSNFDLVEEWIEDITDFQQLSAKTRRTYISDVNNAARILGENDIEFTELTKDNLKSYLSAIRSETNRPEGLSHGRLKGIFSALNSMMEFLIYEEKTMHNPIPSFRKRYMKTYKNDTRASNRRQVPSTEDLALMIAGITDHQHKALHLILAKTGMRRGEAHLLDIESVDLIEGSVTISRTGKRTPTKLPIDKECSDFLHGYLVRLHQFPRVQGERALFTNRNGTRASENTLYEWVVLDATRAGLHEPGADRLDMHKKFTPHHYRHWLTTTLRANGCQERVIRYIRGDSDHNIADRYDHLSWSEIVEEYIKAVSLLTTERGR